MRVFTRFGEAFDEIKRDLGEMGITVKTQTMQDKLIIGNPDFDTRELQNYSYTVTDPRFEDLNPTQPWADEEWLERRAGIEGNPVNPGIAWQTRPEVWREFLRDGQFSYTYSEQFARHRQVLNIIERLRQDPASRQLFVVMWEPRYSDQLGKTRVPCSLGWHFQYRDGKLNMTYMMRSCDFVTHFQNDIYLSMRLQEYVARMAGLQRGNFTQTMFSLHIYAKDIKDVF